MESELSPKAHNSIRIIVAHNAEQVAHALAVRSIVFVEDEGLRFSHAHDPNDYVCSHIVIYDGEEPIGSARVRWFKDFAKIERTAFRKAHRDPRVLKATAQFIFAHAAQKGYDRILTLAEEHYARLWMKLLGFRKLHEEPITRPHQTNSFYMLEKVVSVPEDAVTPETPARIMIRPEGRWDIPLSFG